ncbi:hypothetical protein BGX20_010735, partial [Mortierella sp. AD010]
MSKCVDTSADTPKRGNQVSTPTKTTSQLPNLSPRRSARLVSVSPNSNNLFFTDSPDRNATIFGHSPVRFGWQTPDNNSPHHHSGSPSPSPSRFKISPKRDVHTVARSSKAKASAPEPPPTSNHNSPIDTPVGQEGNPFLVADPPSIDIDINKLKHGKAVLEDSHYKILAHIFKKIMSPKTPSAVQDWMKTLGAGYSRQLAALT